MYQTNCPPTLYNFFIQNEYDNILKKYVVNEMEINVKMAKRC